ncbi:MAG TPA: hypothetical protein VN035_13370 [Microbacterium sp.]|nr:hypothetical protein [Microbacterium sp.]
MDERSGRWPWGIVLLLAVAGPVLAFGSWTGFCADSPQASQSFCMSGPTIGWPAAWTVTALCAALFVYALVRLVRRRPRGRD